MNRYGYVIQGSTGSHADIREWLVEIHTTRASAEDRMYKLNAALDTANLSWGKVDPKEYCTKAHEVRVREFGTANNDPGFKCDYTGTEYMVLALRMV